MQIPTCLIPITATFLLQTAQLKSSFYKRGLFMSQKFNQSVPIKTQVWNIPKTGDY